MRALVTTLDDHRGAVNDLAALSDRQIATASSDRTVEVRDIATRKRIVTLNGHEHWVFSIAVLRVGDGQIASASRDGTVKNRDIETETRVGNPSRPHALGARRHYSWGQTYYQHK